MNKTYRQLLKLRKLTQEINGLLFQEKTDIVSEKLGQRDKIINSLAENDFVNLVSARDDLKTVVKQILTLDKKNMEVVNSNLNKTAASINEIAKEKQSMHALLSLAKVRQKQIVDVLY